MGKDTIVQYKEIQKRCQNIFEAKLDDYGPSWRVMRFVSILDQLFIKVKRIRQLQQTGKKMVDEGPENEWMALVNYAIIALIQRDLGAAEEVDIDKERASTLYHQYFEMAFELMKKKNHDYGEAWREMKLESFADLILVKLIRIRQIIENNEKTKISEGIESNLLDILNYAMFALIKIYESNTNNDKFAV